MKKRKLVKVMPWKIDLKYGEITYPVTSNAWYVLMVKLVQSNMFYIYFDNSLDGRNYLFSEEI